MPTPVNPESHDDLIWTSRWNRLHCVQRIRNGCIARNRKPDRHIRQFYLGYQQRRREATVPRCVAFRAAYWDPRRLGHIGWRPDGPHIRQTSAVERIFKFRLPNNMGAPQVHPALPCPICGISMALVFIEPRVASFTELHIFRCFACGDMRSIEQKASPHNQVARPRPSLFDWGRLSWRLFFISSQARDVGYWHLYQNSEIL